MPHRVFLSSTFSDLEDHRKAVKTSIRQLGAIDVSMEEFGARDERPAEECIKIVREESDLFVGIYAHRYGFIPENAEISVLEMEYRAASESNLPRFIYIIDDNHPVRPADFDQGDKNTKLQSFKQNLLKRHICQRYTGPDQLAAKVVADVGRHIAMQNAPKVGPGIPVVDIGMESLHVGAPISNDEMDQRRRAIYAANRNIFLAHVIRPSTKFGQEFDVSIYLVRHNSKNFPNDLSDVLTAEFFMGPYWENKIFQVAEQNGFVGISTSAYGTFLCTCRVTFSDGKHTDLHRYIDFEGQRTGGTAS